MKRLLPGLKRKKEVDMFNHCNSTVVKKNRIIKLSAMISSLALAAVFLFLISACAQEDYASDGYYYLNNDKYDQALQCFNNELANSPKEYKALMGKGKVLYALKKDQEAIDDYKDVLTTYKNDKDALYQLGCIYYEVGNYKDALDQFDQCSKIDSKDFDVLEWKGYCLIRLGEYDQTAQLCNQLIKEGDKSYTVHDIEGLVYLGQKTYDKAINEFETSIKLCATFQDAYLDKVEALYDSGDEKKFLDFCDLVEKKFPDDYEVYLYKGDYYSDKGQYASALDQYNIALDKSDDKAYIYPDIALQYLYLQQYDMAISYNNKALAINPKDEYALKVKDQIDYEIKPESDKIIEFVKDNYLYINKVKGLDEKCKKISMLSEPTANDVSNFINSIKTGDDRFTFVIKDSDYEYMKEEDNTPQIHTKNISDNIEEIKISSFTPNVGDDFKAAVEKIKDPENKILVIDLRDNGGGDFQAANSMLDILLPKCTTTSFTTRDGKEEKYYSDDNLIKFKKIIIWVNEKSASSSEVMTLSLKKHLKNVTIIGHPTFGKGVGQVLYENKKEKYIIFLVDFYWKVEGECIAGKRINPDILVSGEDDNSYTATTLKITSGN